MRRVGLNRDQDGQLDYHRAATYAADFTVEHPQRISLAKALVDTIIRAEPGRRLTIVELGCGAGDISGPYSVDHEVVGVDVAQPAIAACRDRWPAMTVLWSPVEALSPMTCDILILTEVLEHLVDPGRLVGDWLPLAKWSILGHPMNEPDPPHEPGHIWSFGDDDWRGWFLLGKHALISESRYPLGNWPVAIIGKGKRLRG